MRSVISTWTFSKSGTEQAARALKHDASALSAVEAAISTVENDPSVTSVGYGGLPNANGILQLDAALMTSDGKAGCVMALEGYRSAIPVARLVLTNSPHTALAGKGAAAFAAANGLPPSLDLLTAHASTRHAEFLRGASAPLRHGGPDEMGHTDTVGVIVRDATGALAAGCATSGMQFKHSGRVGDSPIIGAGIFVDACGAAVASGDGDQMMRFCLTFLAVERMRNGEDVGDACRYAMHRVHATDPNCQAAIVAMDASGRTGASCTHRGFKTVTWCDDASDVSVHEVSGVVESKWKHTCV